MQEVDLTCPFPKRALNGGLMDLGFSAILGGSYPLPSGAWRFVIGFDIRDSLPSESECYIDLPVYILCVE